MIDTIVYVSLAMIGGALFFYILKEPNITDTYDDEHDPYIDIDQKKL